MTQPSLVQIMACHLFDTKLISEPMLACCCKWTTRNNFNQNAHIFIQEKKNCCDLNMLMWRTIVSENYWFSYWPLTCLVPSHFMWTNADSLEIRPIRIIFDEIESKCTHSENSELLWCHITGANFVVIFGTGGCHKTTTGATNDDKVGIMTIVGFECISSCKYHPQCLISHICFCPSVWSRHRVCSIHSPEPIMLHSMRDIVLHPEEINQDLVN